MPRLARSIALLALAAPGLSQGLAHVRHPEGALSGTVNGRVLLLFSADPDSEPRFGVRGGLGGARVFGAQVFGPNPVPGERLSGFVVARQVGLSCSFSGSRDGVIEAGSGVRGWKTRDPG